MLCVIFHGEYGWQGFAFVILLTVALGTLVNWLAARALSHIKNSKGPRKKKRHRGPN
jgi:hypothetical protein